MSTTTAPARRAASASSGVRRCSAARASASSSSTVTSAALTRSSTPRNAAGGAPSTVTGTRASSPGGPLVAQEPEDVDVEVARRRGGASRAARPRGAGRRRAARASTARSRGSSRSRRGAGRAPRRRGGRPAPWTRGWPPSPRSAARTTCRPSPRRSRTECSREPGDAGRAVLAVDDEQVELLAPLGARRGRLDVGQRLLERGVGPPREPPRHLGVRGELQQRRASAGVGGRSVSVGPCRAMLALLYDIHGNLPALRGGPGRRPRPRRRRLAAGRRRRGLRRRPGRRSTRSWASCDPRRGSAATRTAGWPTSRTSGPASSRCASAVRPAARRWATRAPTRSPPCRRARRSRPPRRRARRGTPPPCPTCARSSPSPPTTRPSSSPACTTRAWSSATPTCPSGAWPRAASSSSTPARSACPSTATAGPPTRCCGDGGAMEHRARRLRLGGRPGGRAGRGGRRALGRRHRPEAGRARPGARSGR